MFDTELTPTAILNLYNEQVPTAGLSVTHMGWFAPNAPEGVAVGATDTNLNQLITLPVGVRWSIHKADAGTLTEYFRPFCRVLSSLGALVLDWTEITNSFGSTGIRFYADSVVTTGTPTSVRLPTDGFTTAPGVYLDNPVDISSPYDAPQRMTLSQAGHGELEMKIEFGSPRVAGERIECRPQRENGAPVHDLYGESALSVARRLVSLATPGDRDPLRSHVPCGQNRTRYRDLWPMPTITPISRAKLTVAAGIACATAPGDTVIIHPGTYVESVSTGGLGTTDTYITIKGSGAAIVQGNLVVDNDWISVEDLAITLQSLNIQAGADHVRLLSITVTNAPSHGIVLDGSGGAIDQHSDFGMYGLEQRNSRAGMWHTRQP